MAIKCDLVLLSWNNLEILKRCVDSILRNTQTPSCLIIVDNGSTEAGLKDYLFSLKGKGAVEVKLILNAVNEGFAKGMNRGIKDSSAPYVCLLNNDILVTNDWLEEMIKIAEENPAIGIVNPSSNNFGERFGPNTTLDEYASGFRVRSGKWIEMGSGIGFCMLIKREVINKIGYLDEGYGYAYFEDTDYSRLAQKAGYKCAMAKGCYVYHAEGKSGRFLKDKDAAFRRSAEIFDKKWGLPKRVAYAISRGDKVFYGAIIQSISGELKNHNKIWLLEEEGVNIAPMPEHLDLARMVIAKKFFYLAAFWNIIKKKKRFDRMYAGPGVAFGIFNCYGRFRGSEIKQHGK